MSNTPTVYRLINKSNNTVDHFRSANKLASQLLGKRISNFIVIKSDSNGDRLITFETGNNCILAFANHLEAA